MNIWVDMDGVLNRYVRSDYRGSNPVFLQEGNHYYRRVIRDRDAIMMLQMLNNTSNEVFILSRLPDIDSIYDEHYYDKLCWLKDNCPFIESFQFHTTSKVKSRYVIEDYYRNDSGVIPKGNILIDDYNDNLIEWEKAGGIGVKYINGINTESSWSGIVIRRSRVEEDVKNLLLLLNNELI